MPTKYRYYYFEINALGEINRILFALADVEYENITFNMEEWQQTYKALSPFGKVPWLEIIDEKGMTVLSQNHAIAQYLATKSGLRGETDVDDARILMLSESMKEYILSPVATFFIFSTHDEATKRANYTKYVETLPGFFHILENQLKSNGGGDGWLVGDKMSWADVYLAHWADFLPNVVKVTSPLDDCPKLQALVKKVQAVPKFAEWMKSRPTITTHLYQY